MLLRFFSQRGHDMRILLAIGFALMVAACATMAENTLSPERRAALKIESVNVTFSPGAQLVWAEAEAEYQRSKDPNAPTQAFINHKMDDEGRAYVERKASGRIREALDKGLLRATSQGTQPVRLQVAVRELYIAPPAMRLIGQSPFTIRANMTLVDSRSGAVVLEAKDFQGYGGQSGGIIGIALDQVMPDPIDRAARSLANSYRSWLRTGSQAQMGSIALDSEEPPASQ